MLHKQLKFIHRFKPEVSITNRYYIPYCAPCPVCGGSSTLIMNTYQSGKKQYSFCTSCGAAGTGLSPNEADDACLAVCTASGIYRRSLTEFTPNFYKCESLLKNMGYSEPVPPPGGVFSILPGEDAGKIAELLPGNKKHSFSKDFYVVFPVYKKPGFLDSFVYYDGRRYIRSRSGTVKEGLFSGHLPFRYTDRLFVVESLSELVTLACRYRKEELDCPFHFITASCSENADLVFDGVDITADRVYMLSGNAMREYKENALSGVRIKTGSPRIIPVYQRYTVSELISMCDDISTLDFRENMDTRFLAIRRKELKTQYRFFIYRDEVQVSGYGGSEARTVMSGILYVEPSEKENCFDITMRAGVRRAFRKIKNVHRCFFEDRQALNSLLRQAAEEAGDGGRCTILLDWFDKRDILANLLLISRQTEHCCKGGSKCTST